MAAIDDVLLTFLEVSILSITLLFIVIELIINIRRRVGEETEATVFAFMGLLLFAFSGIATSVYLLGRFAIRVGWIDTLGLGFVIGSFSVGLLMIVFFLFQLSEDFTEALSMHFLKE